MKRRTFLKLALVTSGLAVAGYYGSEFLDLSNESVGALAKHTSSNVLVPTNSDWHIPHLLRRVGFGGSPDELSSYQKLGVSVAIGQLLNYESVDDSNLPSQPNITMALTMKPPPGEVLELVQWWVDRMVNTPRPLEEKMTLFWHNHFATAIYKVRSPYLMFKQNQLLRSKGMGDFEVLLMAMTEDPAMLIWLDGARNRKGAANENYGREVMEIFTTGRGWYTEDDVKAASRAFTGYTLNKEGNVTFNPKLHDDGTKTFLGQTGNFGPEDIVKILANHPATAKNISTKLFQYLAYDNPSGDVIDRLANVYTATGGNIRSVVEAILKSDEFFSQQAYLEQVKSPVEYVVAALRSLGASVDPKAAIFALNSMGQLPFNPPSVFGWPSGLAWVNSSTMLVRCNFPLTLQNVTNLSPAVQNGTSVEQLSRILFPEGLPSEVIQTIQQSTDALTDPLDKLRNALRLTMASPFYNLN